MSQRRNHAPKSLPVANYRSAIDRAVEWLGDRYLLARPINSAQSRSAANRLSLNATTVTEAGVQEIAR
jgi:hypothetical protein